MVAIVTIAAGEEKGKENIKVDLEASPLCGAGANAICHLMPEAAPLLPFSEGSRASHNGQSEPCDLISTKLSDARTQPSWLVLLSRWETVASLNAKKDTARSRDITFLPFILLHNFI